jgi:hypothetical protein
VSEWVMRIHAWHSMYTIKWEDIPENWSWRE